MPSNIAIDILPILLLFLCIFGAKITKPLSSINSKDYLSLATCKSYRGLFAIVVIFHHIAMRTESGVIFPLFIHMGSLAVAFFFFLSGYGLQKSYIIKSEYYKKEFLLKRIPTVLIPYIIITTIYWLWNLSLGQFYSLKDIIHRFIVGDPIAIYSWFIVNILCFYIVFWLLMHICKKHYLMMILGGLIWYILHTIFCIKMQYDSHWYITCHLLVFGMFWAIYEHQIINLFKKKNITIFISLVSFFIIHYILKRFIPTTNETTHILKSILPLLFTLSFVICTLAIFMKIQIGNKILNFLGEISLELYLSHALFKFSLRSKYIYISNELIWCISVLAGTILFSYGLHILFQAILKAYKRIILKQKVIN